MSCTVKHHLIALLLISVITSLVYFNSLKGEFVYDDERIVQSKLIRSLKNIPAIFSTSFLELDKKQGLYRPLVASSYTLNYALGRLDPYGYHVIDVSIHILNSLLVYYLLFSILKEVRLSLFIGLFFATHPIHTEAVANVMGRAELLATFFFLISLILYIKSFSSDRAKWYYYLSLMTFLLALLSKENAIVLIGVLVLYDLCFQFKGLKSLIGRLKSHYAGYFSVLCLYLIIRYLVLGSLRAQHIAFHNNPLAYAPLYPRLLTAAKVAVRYLQLLFMPLNLSADYSYNQIPVSTSILETEVLISIAVLGAVLWTAVWSYRKSKPIFFALGLSLVMFSIVSNVIFPIGGIMAERLLYLPSLGFCALLGMLCKKASTLKLLNRQTQYPAAEAPRPVLGPSGPTRGRVGEHSLRSTESGYISVALVLLIVLLYSYRTVIRNRDWRDGYALFSSTVRTSPNSAKAHYNLGTIYKNRGLLDQAIEEYKRALEIEPGLPIVGYNLGNVYKDKGVLDQAIAQYKRVLEMRPNLAEVHYNLGIAYKDKGMLDEAIDEYKRTLEIDPGHADAHNNLGNIYKDEGLLDQAIVEYKEVLKVKPDLAEAHYNLANTYRDKGLNEMAVQSYRNFIKYWRGNIRYTYMAQEQIRRLQAH